MSNESIVCSDIIMLEMLTLCRAKYRKTCITICGFFPRYKCATVLYSTFAWNASFPWIVDIVSMRNRETAKAMAPNKRKAKVGLYITHVSKCHKADGSIGTNVNQPACWNSKGIVVNPGPVMELINKAVPP
jgi:hypothetical protein